jgi:integrase/recombinase XerD
VKGIRDGADRYLAIRRGLGYKLKVEGRMLGQFVGFLEERGDSHLTVQAALEWAVLPGNADPAWWAARLTVIREFARFLATFDELTEIPPPGLLPRRAGRTPPPYLYSQAEITALIHAARHLAHPLRAATFESFIGLMAATGIRTGEAMGLDRCDPDLDRGVLLVRGTKFGKSRLVPLHPTTVERLADYQRRRDELCPRPSTEAFFLSGAGTRLNHTNASKTFTRLLTAVGLTAPAGAGKPRLLSRPGARCRDCSRSVSPDRSPNPPYRSLGNGLSTVAAVRQWLAKGLGSCCPGRCSGRPSHLGAGNTRPRRPRSTTARRRFSGDGGVVPSSSRGGPAACGRVSTR